MFKPFEAAQFASAISDAEGLALSGEVSRSELSLDLGPALTFAPQYLAFKSEALQMVPMSGDAIEVLAAVIASLDTSGQDDGHSHDQGHVCDGGCDENCDQQQDTREDGINVHVHDHDVNPHVHLSATLVEKAQASVIEADLRDAIDAGEVDGGSIEALLGLAADMAGLSAEVVAANFAEAVQTLSAPVAPALFGDGTLTGDTPGDNSSTQTLAIGGSVSGATDFGGDTDWYAVELTAGTQYTFLQLRSGENPHDDPYVALYDASGTFISENDDIDSDGDGQGDNRNSLLTYTPTESGTYYVSAQGWDSDDGSFQSTGDYTLYAEVGEGRPDFTLEQAAFFLTDQFDARASWEVREISYDVSAVSAQDQSMAIAAMQAWEDVSGLTFVQVTAGQTALLSFVNTGEGAFASTSTTDLAPDVIIGASVNIDKSWSVGDGTFVDDPENPGADPISPLNNYRYQTFLHEIGHAIGLGHGGPYNGFADYGVNRAYNQDAWNYTVMSYFDQNEAGSGTARLALGLQTVDIIAAQALYGAAAVTRGGDTVYGNNSTEAADSIFNFAAFTNNNVRIPSFAIADTDGIDTLDVSAYAGDQLISLVEGTFSDIGVNYNVTDQGALQNVLSIAPGTVIENAIGGTGSDTIVGNAADNVLQGGQGNDTLFGGDGNDVAVFAGNDNFYTVTENPNGTVTVVDQRTDQDGTDILTSIETLRFDNGDVTVNAPPTTTFTAQADNGVGTVGDDTIDALGGDDTVDGLAGNDTLFGNLGADTLIGGAGNDLLIGDTPIGLTAIEGQVYRAYQAVFDRDPDAAGFNAFRTEIRLGNLTQEDVIAEFVDSTEFGLTYGELDNAAFVGQLYQNVLNRAATQSEAQPFINELNAGRERASIVIEFANSTEFVNLMNLGSASFAQTTTINPVEAQVFRVYKATLDRAPDAGGFNNFVNSIQAGVLTLDAVITQFVESPEFQQSYGDLDNAAFVELLYSTVLPGNTDADGRAAFTASLDGGATRASVVAEFSESFEFTQNTDAEALAFVRGVNADAPSDMLSNAGGGDDQLFGGSGADTFLIAADAGTDSIMDFAVGVDQITFDGIDSLDTFAEIQAAMIDVGASTQITTGTGSAVLLVNVASGTLTAEDFGLVTPAAQTPKESGDLTADLNDDFGADLAQTALPELAMGLTDDLDVDVLMSADFDVYLA